MFVNIKSVPTVISTTLDKIADVVIDNIKHAGNPDYSVYINATGQMCCYKFADQSHPYEVLKMDAIYDTDDVIKCIDKATESVNVLYSYYIGDEEVIECILNVE